MRAGWSEHQCEAVLGHEFLPRVGTVGFIRLISHYMIPTLITLQGVDRDATRTVDEEKKNIPKPRLGWKKRSQKRMLTTSCKQ